MGLTKKLQLIGNIEVDDAVINELVPDAGQHLAISAVTGKDIKINLADNAAARKLIIYDSDAKEVANIDSDGGITATSLVSSGVITGTTVTGSTRVVTPIINDTDTDTLKIVGEVSTRNAADNSMYVPVTDSTGHERGFKIAYAPAANGGGYFESAFINTKVNASMAGTVRASEHKVSITGTANASGEAVAVYAKVNVETGATVASAVGVDVKLDPEGSATVTAATGIRVNGDAKMTDMIDVSSYDKATNSAIKLPNVDGNKAVAIANLETAFGTDDNKEGIIGLYQDNSDAVWLIVGNSRVGKYYKIQTAIVDS